jgi:multiple sugar transport system permease protein
MPMSSAAPPKVALQGGPSQTFRRTVLIPPIALISALMAFGFAGVIYFALHKVDIYTLWPQGFVGLDNFKTFLFSKSGQIAFTNTIIWIAVSVTAITALGLLTGLFLAREGLIIRVTRAFMLVPWVLPGVVTASLFRWFFQTQNGIINNALISANIIDRPIRWLSSPDLALYSVCIAIVWRLFPLFALVISAAIKTVDRSLYDAASIDGASAYQKFLFVTLPSIRQPLLTMILLVTIWVSNNLVFVNVMTGGGPVGRSDIIPNLIYKTAFEVGDVGLASGQSVVNIAILAAIGALYIRTLRNRHSENG